MKPRKPLGEMGREGSQPMQLAGKPADVCPACGAAMFVDGVNRTEHEIVRYVECRNKKCRRRFLTRQQPAKLIREVGNSADGKDNLTYAVRFA